MLTVVIAGSLVVLACWFMLRRKSRQMRSEFQRQLGTLSAAVRTLEQDAAQRATAADNSPPADIPKIKIVAAKPAVPIVLRLPTDQESTAIAPETQVVIKAALSAFLGHEVQIRSVKLLETPDVAAAWTTQGRIAVQTSHNQRTNRG
jgi:hypothetical protein